MTRRVPLNSTASVQAAGSAGAGTAVGDPPAAPASELPFGPALGLTIALAVGSFLLIAPLALLLLPATELPPPFAAQHQDAETLLFIAAFAVNLPLSGLAAARIGRRIAAAPDLAGPSAVVALLAVALLAALLLVKLSERLPWGGGLETLLAAAALWCGAATVILLWAGSPRSRRAIAALGRHAATLWWTAGALGLLLVLAFAELSSIALLPLLAAAGLAVAGAALAERFPSRRLGRPLGLGLDVLVAGVLLLAVPNLVIFMAAGLGSGFETTIIQFHQNFFLGPANEVLGGDAMLVDVLSQYGVGSIYFLAGVFQVVPIGNGTLGLIEGLLSAGMFIAAYGVLRIAGVSRLLAATAMLIAVIALVYGLEYPLGGLLQHGAIRFGLPILLIVAAVAEARWPRRGTLARLGGLLAVGLSSIWALEAFGYTLLVALALIALRASWLPAGERRPRLLRWLLELGAACALAHVLLAGITLAASGQLPPWGRYLTTLRDFLFGEIGDLTYDFSAWSPGVAVGALYLACIAAIVLVLRRRPELAERERIALIALVGATAWGVALLSYVVNRSADHIIPYVCLPAVMVVALWLSLLLRPSTGATPGLRRAGLTAALAVSALLVAVAWSSVELRFSQSALAHAVPGGSSLRGALQRLWTPPPLKPGAAEGERLLARYMPGEPRSLVLTDADLSVEILIRAGRSNELPFGDPWEDSFVPGEHLEPLGEAVSNLSPGERILIDEPARAVFEAYRGEPGRDPLAPREEPSLVPTGLASLQVSVLTQLAERFRLRPLARGEGGLLVAELVPR